jgi:outer membrane biosynthesis protein TonB
MWEQLQAELKNSKIYIYSVAITACILSIFGFVIFVASFNNSSSGNLPSPAPTDYASILGAQTANQNPNQNQISQENIPSVGPEQPVVQPSPSPSPKESPSPSVSPSPTPSPSISPSPTPTPTSTPTPTPQSNSDTSGPAISAIQAKNVESKKATIEWTTNEDADSKVEYGKDSGYGMSKDQSDKKTSHSQELTDLVPNTTYHYRISSKDNANNSSVK